MKEERFRVMKKLLSLILAVTFVAAAFASCAVSPAANKSAKVRAASSDGESAAAWLTARLGDRLTDKVVLATGADAYGVDLTSLEKDGYVIRPADGETALFAKSAQGLDRAARAYAKRVERGDPIVAETYHEGVRVERVTVAGNDISEYAIRVEGEWEYLKGRVASVAAQSFSDLMYAACGVRVPFGDAPRAVIFRQIADDSFGEASFRYFVENGDLIFEYVNEQGANYGVWSFFEDQLGCEEIACGQTFLREAEQIDVAEGFTYRVDPLLGSGHFPYDGYGFNTSRSVARETGSAAVNAMYNYKYRIPIAMHGMQTNRWAGVAVEHYQICYSDENKYQYAADSIYTFISNKLDAGAVIGDDFTSVDIAQGDNLGYCGCKACRLTISEENGAWSSTVVRWANRLAAEMEENGFGGLKYLIYAYHGTNKPCVTKPRPDVFVSLCMDGNCSRHALDGSQCQWESFDMAGYWGKGVHLNNNDYAGWIRGWGELCDSGNLYVWYYMLNNNVRSYTLIDRLWDDMHFMSESGVSAVFVEGETYSGYGPLWLQHKIMTELQLHPQIGREDYRLLVGRVFENAFGDGWREVLRAMDLWEEAQMAKKSCGNCWGYMSLTNYDNVDAGVFLASWDEALALLDSAIDSANSAEQETNVKRLSLSFLYNGCYYAYFPAYEADDAETLAKVGDRYDLMIRRFAEVGLSHKSIRGLAGDVLAIGDTVEQTAWTVWLEDRAKFFEYGAELKPVPAQ